MPKEKYENEENLDVITLKNTEGEEVDFFVIAGINLDDRYYMILQPTVKMADMSEDEALVFEYFEDEENQDNSSFSLTVDDDIIERVFASYNKLLDEQENKK